jgi:predicted TIM-barrel fold metal-dependent hydrolase
MTPAAPKLPPLACDCHMHIFGPRSVFPYFGGRIYTPPEASVDEYLAMRQKLGLERVVLVQPSVYGTDNGAQADGIARIPGARGVAVMDGNESDADIEALHKAGFRGTRINLQQGSIDAPIEIVLERTGARLKEIGWHLQIFAQPAVVESVAPILSRFPVPVMFDHFCGLSPWLGIEQPGYDVVRGLLKDGPAWMKLSAAYHSPRRETEGGPAKARDLVADLYEAAPGRLVWGSNWPHPNVLPKTTPTEAPIAPFRKVDDVEMLSLMVGWADGDEAMLKRVMSDNPGRLYDF